MTNLKYVLYFSFMLLLFGCSVNSSVVNYDYSYLYDNNQSIINPLLKVFHSSADSSTLFYEIKSDDILYETLIEDSAKAAIVRVKYSLYNDREMTSLIDSSSQNLANFGANGENALLQNKLTFKLESGKVAWLSVKLRDANKDFNVVNLLKVDKRRNFNNQYFKYLAGDQIIFQERLFTSNFTLEKSPLISENDFIMTSTNKSFPMTPPPFTAALRGEFNFIPEQSYSFSFNNHQASLNIKAPINYFFPKSDSSAMNAIVYFGENFPKLSKIEQLRVPTRYISTSREYKDLNNAVNPKKGLDEFWLKLGRNEEGSKSLLKEYYKRVEMSNQFFTSYKEGWKTDRGIIYIIYGIPSSIRKNADKEVWLYGEANNVLSVQFRFYKPESSKFTNHYELVRNSDYKNNWYRQVDLWRQGKID